MNIFFDQHLKILHSLIRYKVRFILIGGYAVNFHGYIRATGDMDLWLEPSKDNQKHFVAMLKAEGFSEDSIRSVAALDFSQPSAFHIGQEPVRIAFLTGISGIDFYDAWKNRNELTFENLTIPVISFADLIVSKLTTGRTRDKLDVEELQQIERIRKSRKQ